MDPDLDHDPVGNGLPPDLGHDLVDVILRMVIHFWLAGDTRRADLWAEVLFRLLPPDRRRV
jgi:hypothetical protein